MKTSVLTFGKLIEDSIQSLRFGERPSELYEPIRYIMDLGGKRMRPLLTLLSYSLFKKDVACAVQSAVAVEVFHNFTLMHDDIMDCAPLRRGNATVHQKWNNNVAILSGDVMLINVYKLWMMLRPDQLKEVLQVFNQCATEVCEGQQIDMGFEKKDWVSEAEYLEMIQLKTACLLGFAMELGAVLGGANVENRRLLKEFGTCLGMGFQLKDDLLDVFGDQSKFGKQVGGDILANKKTFLLIKSLELAQNGQQEQLRHWLNLKKFDKQEKVMAITKLYEELGIRQLTEQKTDQYFEACFAALDKVEVPSNDKSDLRLFAEKLINREH